jgi:hypothetical protein
MFIPNKTFHAMRVGVVSLIAMLLIVIAGQTVLYHKLQRDTQAKVDSLTLRVESLAQETTSEYRNARGRQDGMDELLFDVSEKVNNQSQIIPALQSSLEKLLRNECTPPSAMYYLTQDMVAVCRTLGQ